MLTPEFLKAKFAAALPYDQYVATGTPDQQANWGRTFERVRLTDAQSRLVKGFTRRVNVLVSSGLWCGDCAHQCPMLARIAQTLPADTSRETTAGIDLRFTDRDKHADLAERIKICGGNRVPTAVFFSDDYYFVSLLGDKTLARLRAKAAKALGEFCPLPGEELPKDEAAATLQNWLDEFERVHLLLRLSPRLRSAHGD